MSYLSLLLVLQLYMPHLGSPTTGCAQNQTSSESRSFPRAWCGPNIHGGGYNALPWLGLDDGEKRTREFCCESTFFIPHHILLILSSFSVHQP